MTQPNTVHLHLHAHVTSPSASHPQSATTLTPDQMEDARFGVGLVDVIERCAKEAAKDDASPSGAYIVGVLVTGSGRVYFFDFCGGRVDSRPFHLRLRCPTPFPY